MGDWGAGNATQPETLNGPLHLEHGSVWLQTLPKRVSDDSRHFIFLRQKILVGEYFGQTFCFSQFLLGFGGATAKRTSKSDSASNFAPDTPILRSVRRQIIKNVCTKARGSKGLRVYWSKGLRV